VEGRLKLRLISAIGYRLDEADSEALLSGKASDEVFRLSSNYGISELLIAGFLMAGVMLGNSQIEWRNFYRLNWCTYSCLNKNPIRFNTSKAVLLPDLLRSTF